MEIWIATSRIFDECVGVNIGTRTAPVMDQVPRKRRGPGSKPVRGWRVDAKLGGQYANTDHRREYMREYMRNRRAAKRGVPK